jgi:hypothetical protein
LATAPPPTFSGMTNFQYHLVIGPLTNTLKHLPEVEPSLIYISGSAGLCTSAAETLYHHGAAPSNIHYELELFT